MNKYTNKGAINHSVTSETSSNINISSSQHQNQYNFWTYISFTIIF